MELSAAPVRRAMGPGPDAEADGLRTVLGRAP
jgi:hypothetical protein